MYTENETTRIIPKYRVLQYSLILVVNICYVLEVYSSGMFYIVLCTRSMNYIVVFNSF